MGENYSTNDVRNLIARILSNEINNIEEILEELNKISNRDDLIMLIFALDVCDFKSSIIKLKTNQFKNIILEQYLTNEIKTPNKLEAKNCSTKEECPTCDDEYIYISKDNLMPYEPLTEEKAMRFVFTDKDVLPPPGSTTHMNQKFNYDEEDGFYACDRRFIIDSDGHVVKFLGEHTKKISNLDGEITTNKNYTIGTLADLLNIDED